MADQQQPIPGVDTRMNRGEIGGLALLLAAFFITGGTLAYDLYRLKVQKILTISEEIWVGMAAWENGTGPFPWLAVLLVAGVALQAVGLAWHFAAGRVRRRSAFVDVQAEQTRILMTDQPIGADKDVPVESSHGEPD